MAPRHVCMLVSLLGASLALGCGGGEPPPAQSPQSPTPQAASKPKPAAQPAEGEGEPKGDEAAKPAEPEVYKPDRPPREIITTEDSAFEFNFSASEIGEKTSDKCEAEAEGDMKARNECKREVQDKVGVTIQRFIEQQGTWWWITYQRRGRQLTALHRIAFEWGEETDNTIQLKPVGKDQGMAPLSPVPRSVIITIPNSYSIELNDKQWGRMQYSTKFGMFPKK
jgi:hypothetical protein